MFLTTHRPHADKLNGVQSLSYEARRRRAASGARLWQIECHCKKCASDDIAYADVTNYGEVITIPTKKLRLLRLSFLTGSESADCRLTPRVAIHSKHETPSH